MTRDIRRAQPVPWARAIGGGLLIWLIGFAWGTVVFMTPPLRSLPAIPGVSRYPAISFPLLVVFPALAYVLARRATRSAAAPGASGLRLGLVFAGINWLLDVVVLAVAFGNGVSYFGRLSVWLGYLSLIVAGRAAARAG